MCKSDNLQIEESCKFVTSPQFTHLQISKLI